MYVKRLESSLSLTRLPDDLLSFSKSRALPRLSRFRRIIGGHAKTLALSIGPRDYGRTLEKRAKKITRTIPSYVNTYYRLFSRVEQRGNHNRPRSRFSCLYGDGKISERGRDGSIISLQTENQALLFEFFSFSSLLSMELNKKIIRYVFGL